MFSFCKGFTYLILILILLQNCNPPEPLYMHKTIRDDSAKGLKRAEQIRQDTPIELADGLEVSLWASDSLAPDPIAMSIDDYGRVYLTRSNRYKTSEFDIRGHRDWMTASI
jgi:quinoprotein glucose dehydrogenase